MQLREVRQRFGRLSLQRAAAINRQRAELQGQVTLSAGDVAMSSSQKECFHASLENIASEGDG